MSEKLTKIRTSPAIKGKTLSLVVVVLSDKLLIPYNQFHPSKIRFTTLVGYSNWLIQTPRISVLTKRCGHFPCLTQEDDVTLLTNYFW